MKRFFTVLLMLFVLTGLVACKEEHEHCATDNLENNDEYHWYSCEADGCEERLEKEKHSWDSGKITIAPEKGKEGIRTFVCKVCKTVRTEFVSPLVTDSQWKLTTALSGVDNVTVDFEERIEDKDTVCLKKYHIEIANNNAYMTIVTYNNDKETSYYGRLIEAGLYVWEFSSREDTTATVSPRVAKSDDLVSIANLFSDYGIKLENSYDSFAFNKDTERYEASNIALENASFSHISMKIEKSKILELEAVKNDEAKVSLSFRLSSYGTTKINPPKAQ